MAAIPRGMGGIGQRLGTHRHGLDLLGQFHGGKPV
jgi:hypothetical protein